MDQIDINLLEAWQRIGAACRADRVEALRRMRRARGVVISRPLRAWCMVLRASDRRINNYRCIIDPKGADEEQVEHDVVIDGPVVRMLNRAVMIPWPGVPHDHAAARVGITKDMMRCWLKKKWLRVSRHDVPTVHGRKGKPIPIVYTPSPVDPNNCHGRGPEAMWGSLWQDKAARLPDEFEARLRRVPRFKAWRGKCVFRGWDWVCPGLKKEFTTESTEDTEEGREFSWEESELGEKIPHPSPLPLPEGEGGNCGRLCRYVYGPLPVWTLARAGEEVSLAMPEESGLAGEWMPGLHELEMGAPGGARTFACKECWQVRNVTMLNHSGWNDFVACLSGGLLYGHEVERPLELAPKARKRGLAAWTHRNRKKKDMVDSAGLDVHSARGA